MQNRSLFQTILLIVFGVLAVAGVMVFALLVNTGEDTSVGKVEIWGTLNAKAFNAIIGAESETDTRLGQVAYIQKDAETYESELTNALAVGGGPDAFLLRNDYVISNFGKALPFAQVTPALFKSAFVDAADSYLSGAGAIAFPLVVDPLVLYWNKDTLSEAGLARPPAYWDDVLKNVQSLTSRDDSGRIIRSGIALGEYSNIQNAKDILSAIILQSGGTITGQDSAGRIVPSLAARAGEDIQPTETALRLFTQFADPSSPYYSWNKAQKEARSAFADGETALYIGYGSEAPIIKSMNPNLNFEATRLPQTRASGKTLTFSHIYALAVSRAGRNPNGASIAAQILADSPIADNISIALGMSPASRKAISSATPSKDPFLMSEALIARSWYDPNPGKTSDIFRAMIERVSSGAMRLSESVERADQELASLLGI